MMRKRNRVRLAQLVGLKYPRNRQLIAETEHMVLEQPGALRFRKFFQTK